MMMNDNNRIEAHVRFAAKHYRPGVFDPAKGWERMQRHISPRSQRRRLPLFVGAAAAVALLLVTAILFYPATGGEKLVAQADNTRFVLPDSTRVEMQKGAELRYGRHFGEKERQVSIKGVVAFDVERDEERPFTVTTATAEVRVLGTEFTVDGQDNGTRLEVKSGKVEFSSGDPMIRLICTTGARVNYRAGTNETTVTQAASRAVINPTEGLLLFENMPLGEVALILSHYYDLEVVVPDEESEIGLTSSFKQKEPGEIIDIINFTLDTHIGIEQKN